jgi:hypothetical protein
MATLDIPVTPDPFQSLRVRLDGVDYLLSLAYNQREDRIYLSLADDEENPIVSGIKVLANWPLLFRHRYNPAIPPGELMAIDTTTDGSPPGLGELGAGLRVQLIYFEAATLAQIKAGVDPSLVT